MGFNLAIHLPPKAAPDGFVFTMLYRCLIKGFISRGREKFGPASRRKDAVKGPVKKGAAESSAGSDKYARTLSKKHIPCRLAGALVPPANWIADARRRLWPARDGSLQRACAASRGRWRGGPGRPCMGIASGHCQSCPAWLCIRYRRLLCCARQSCALSAAKYFPGRRR